MGLTVIIIASAIGLLWWGSYKRNRYGINVKLMADCPNCGTKLPAVRIPKTLKQALWGGWTCPTCGTESDKWGGRDHYKIDE